MKPSLPFVTVVMPVFNEVRFIEDSLSAILTQDYPAEKLEILVVDGGSSDGTQQIVQEIARNHSNIIQLHNPKHIQAAALNIGISAARGDIVVRIDGHTVVAPDYVSMCVNRLTKCNVDNVGGLMRPVGLSYVGKGIALATTFPFGIGDSKFHYSDREQYVDTVYLGAFWRHIFDEIGLYDENVHINEDYELNYRLRKAGKRILLSPAIQSTYYPRSSIPALIRQYFVYGRQKIRTLRKHPQSLRWRQTIPPLFVGSLFIALVLGLWWTPALWLFAFILSVYLLANSVASTIVAGQGGWQYLPVLPVVFATIHFSWGLGFWYGMVLALLGANRHQK